MNWRGGWPYRIPPHAPITINRESPQARGLIAWWTSLSAPGSKRQYDMVTHASFAENNTPTWTTAGARGLGLDLDAAATEYIETTEVAKVPTAPSSFVAWGRLGGVNTFTNYTMMTFTDPDVGFSRGAGLRISTRGVTTTVNALYLHDGNSINSGDITISTGEWLCAAGVSSTANNHELFFQGLSRGTNVVATSYAGVDTLDVGVNSLNNAYNEHWEGQMYEVRVYNRALSAAEVWAQYAPATRWELYQSAPRRAWFIPGVARIPRPTAAYNNLAIY